MSGGGRGEVGVVGSAGTTCMHAPKPEPWRGRLPPSTQQKLAAWAEAFGAAVQPFRDLLQLHVWDRLGWKAKPLKEEGAAGGGREKCPPRAEPTPASTRWMSSGRGKIMRALRTLALCALTDAFIWPGVAPREYKDGEVVPMNANKLSSVRTQISRSYYALPFCSPHKLTRAPESLGEVMNGNVVQAAPFELRFGLTRTLVLCKVDLDNKGRLLWAKRVREDYRGHLLLDNLPVATRLSGPVRPERPHAAASASGVHYERGYSLGFVRQPGVRRLGITGTAYLHNHLAFRVGYFAAAEGCEEGRTLCGRIVSFEVVPHSLRYSYERKWPEGPWVADGGTGGEVKDPLNLHPDTVGLRSLPGPLSLDDPATRELVFTYNVTWHRSDVPYSSRWDLYLYMEEGESIHWFSLTGSLSISLALAGLVAAIMVRTVRRDLQRYNAEEGDELLYEVGWKYCHADVLRPPPQPLLLASCVGSGVQLSCMVLVSLLLSFLGFLSPTVRGRLLTAALLLYAAAGAPAGYAAARLYRQMHGRRVYELVGLAVGCAEGGLEPRTSRLGAPIDLLLTRRGPLPAQPLPRRLPAALPAARPRALGQRVLLRRPLLHLPAAPPPLRRPPLAARRARRAGRPPRAAHRGPRLHQRHPAPHPVPARGRARAAHGAPGRRDALRLGLRRAGHPALLGADAPPVPWRHKHSLSPFLLPSSPSTPSPGVDAAPLLRLLLPPAHRPPHGRHLRRGRRRTEPPQTHALARS